MSAQHFKELVETVCMTKGVSQKKLADMFNVSEMTVVFWKKNGVSKIRAIRVSQTLREYCRG